MKYKWTFIIASAILAAFIVAFLYMVILEPTDPYVR